ncbi:MAG: hypothetical protein LBP53_02850 [Candidatus Peribacteria bacterium]|jgi:hypothetical protein|nr:hypothetical protein [Candidatus Peribacteria bacterium]
MGGYAQWRIIARHTYDNVNNINYMYQGVISPNHHNTIGLVRNSTASNNYSLHYDAPQSVVLPENRLLKGELITESISTDETRITFNIYDLEDEGKLLATTTMLDATPELQQSGQWGVWTHQIPAFRKFDLYAMDANISVFAVNTIALDTGLFIKFYDDGENTITLSDGNMQGTFSENPVILNDNNNYQATVIYTPAKAGYIVLSGIQSANNAEAIRHKLFVSPYATIIGFIGDSISLDANFHTVEETILNL